MLHTTRSLTMIAALALAPAALAAQETPADARWQAWIGCWQPVSAPDMPASSAVVCVVPAGAQAVDLVSIASRAVERRERVDAGGQPQPSAREACAGTERARWSEDGRRVFLRSEHTCDGTRFGATGVMALAPSGEWIDVRGVSMAGGPADVRVRRFRPLLDPTLLPDDVLAEVNAAVAARPMVRAAVVAAASAEVGTAQVVEASKDVDAAVVEAWLVERGEGFTLDAKRLVALADAGVPERVIDVMVALSYPKKFAIDRTSRDAKSVPDTARRRVTDTLGLRDYGLGQRAAYCNSGLLPPTYCNDYTTFGYSAYGYNRYGYNGLDPWGLNPYGYGYGYGYYGQRPVVVVRDPATAQPQGRAVNGKGYTRGGSSGGETATPRSTSSGSSSSGSADRSTTRSSGSSSGGSTKSSSGSGTSTGRTAKPRP